MADHDYPLHKEHSLQALLEYWPRTHVNPIDEEENEVNHGSYFYIRIIGFKITLKLRIFRLLS